MREISNTTSSSASPVVRSLVRPVLASSFFFMVVTGIAYPTATTGVAKLLFHNQAQGSLIERNGEVVGSAVIGQNFTRAEYFHGRPSATTAADPSDASKTVDQPYNAAASAASNQGVLSKKLLDAVTARTKAYREENALPSDAPVPVDAVTASASGLDPDVSVANARLQASRVAKARGLALPNVLALVERHTKGRQIGVLGDLRVNVLELNLALDAADSVRPAAQ